MSKTHVLKADLPGSSGVVGDRYYAKDSGEDFVWDGSSMVNLGVFNDEQVAALAAEVTRAKAAATTAAGTFTKAPVATPGTAGAAGVAGTWSFDATHIYVCIATNTWVRATLATW